MSTARLQPGCVARAEMFGAGPILVLLEKEWLWIATRWDVWSPEDNGSKFAEELTPLEDQECAEAVALRQQYALYKLRGDSP